MSLQLDSGGNGGELTLKRMLMFVPLVAASACTTDDMEMFADALNQTAYELDAQMNAPCPGGMYRQHVSDTLVTSYPQYSYEQVGYQVNPLGGGYSYCAFPVYYTHDDDHHGDRRDRDRHDGEYSDGYRDGYRDGRRDD
jgi:hypothetical protein